jgi:hypothetical protein
MRSIIAIEIHPFVQCTLDTNVLDPGQTQPRSDPAGDVFIRRRTYLGVKKFVVKGSDAIGKKVPQLPYLGTREACRRL